MRHEFTTDGESGSVTVYLTLMLLIVASLLGALLEGARQAGVKSAVKSAAATGLDSLFAMYDESLFEQYGLLFQNEELLETEAADQIKEYMNWSANPNSVLLVDTPNLLSFEVSDVTITNKYYASDDGGIFFQREVAELMKYQETASLVSSLTSYLSQLANADKAYEYVVEKNDSYENTDWGEIARQAGGDAEDGETEDGGSTGLAEFSNQDVEDALEGSIITQVEQLVTETLLSLFVDDAGELSEKTIDNDFEFGTDHGIGGESGLLTDTAQNVLLGEYIMAYMSSYVRPSQGSGLSYEAEYIINGSGSDQQNLLAVLTEILLMRMGLNIVFLLTNAACFAQTEEMALSLVGWTGIYPLVVAVELMLVAAWAFCESVLDVRALADGKKVPFFKTYALWTTGLETCAASVIAGEQAKESSSGLGYDSYIRILLLMQTAQTKTSRCMCEIEQTMRGGYDYDFSFDKCLYGVEIRVEARAKQVFSGLYQAVYKDETYVYELLWSQTY